MRRFAIFSPSVGSESATQCAGRVEQAELPSKLTHLPLSARAVPRMLVTRSAAVPAPTQAFAAGRRR